MPAVQSWADDVEPSDIPQRTESTDKDGVTTIVEHRLNEDGKRVKITRRIKRTVVKTSVNHAVAERMHWTKFGAEKGHKPGPDLGTTTVGENVRLKLQAGGIKSAEQEEEDEAQKRKLMPVKNITCRLCSGDHWTNRCPYKETLGGIAGDTENNELGEGGEGAGAGAASTTVGGKYVPPSMRAGAKGGAGESMDRRNRDDFPTLRVTNLSEDATEDDLWNLFGRFGRINRIYVGKDQETGLCKGFAFVSFDSKSEAEKALTKIDGLPYDHLILKCAWSLPKTDKP